MNQNQNLLVSAANGDLQGVLEALTSGADINTKDSNGFTALQFATYNAQLEVLQILVEANADPNVFDYKNYNNYTPLHYSASFNQMDIVKVLLQSQTNPHVPNGEGKYPINLTTSEQVRNVIYEDQEKRRTSVPQQQPLEQQQFQQQQPQQMDQPQGCRWSNICSKFKCCNGLKKAKKIFGVLFFLFPLIYCVFTPFSFPWFIYPCGFMAAIFAFKKLKKQKEELKAQGLYKFQIHVLVFTFMNVINFIGCLWWRSIFFAVSVLSFWGSLLAIHALKTKYQKSKKNNGFFIHFLIFSGLLIASFITYTHATCLNRSYSAPQNNNYGQHHYGHHQGYGNQQGSQHHYGKRNHPRWNRYHSSGCNRTLFGMLAWFSPFIVWAVILYIHYLKHKGNTELNCCGIKISFNASNGNQSEETDVEAEEQIVQENVEQNQNQQQQVEEIQIEQETPDFNNPNIQILYPKVL